MSAPVEGNIMVNVLVAIVLVAHGIGHVIGPLGVLRVADVGPTAGGDSWLLTTTTGQQLSSVIGIVLWTAVTLGFIASAAVVLGWLPAPWWAPLAVASAAVSLIAIVLFPTAFPTGSTIGAVVVDIGVLIAVVLLDWAPKPAGA